MTGIFYVLLWNGGGTDTEIRVSTESRPWRRKFPRLEQQGFEPATCQSRVRRSNHWAILAPFSRFKLDLAYVVQRAYPLPVSCSCFHLHRLWFCYSVSFLFVYLPPPAPPPAPVSLKIVCLRVCLSLCRRPVLSVSLPLLPLFVSVCLSLSFTLCLYISFFHVACAFCHVD